MTIEEDLDKLIYTLPFFVQKNLNNHPQKNRLIEIIMDLGRRPEVRFTTGSEYLSQKTISWQDIDYTTKRISQFSDENRAGIERTLHRISCIRNRQTLINGLTCRVGRAVLGTTSVIRDLLELGQSILILGKPGIGKTTIVREIARVLADEIQKRVIIIDTANEIAGDSNIPHSGIGRARRMQVSKSELQHQIMIEAIENHMPEVIIIDEIGTELEALAARTISEKGVQLVGTTHGNCLENLIKNPVLMDLIGGIQYVTLSDDEAKRRGTQKSVLERKAYPAFQIAIEINHQNFWTIHENIKDSIDLILRGAYSIIQTRELLMNYKTIIKYQKLQLNSVSFLKSISTLKNQYPLINNNWLKINQSNDINKYNKKTKNLLIYNYSLSNSLIKEAIKKLGLRFSVTKKLKKASFIIGLKKHLKQNRKLKNLAHQKDIVIYSINHASIYQLIKVLQILIY